MPTNTQKALAAASALLLGVPTAALSHTNSIGYVGDGQGGVTFWYGSWHSGTTFNEGELKLQGANGTTFAPTITQFTLLQNSTPAGLIPGTNYFQSNGTTLQAYADGAGGLGGGSASYTWQGVTFTGLAAGDYTFTYIPLGDPQSYQPNGYPTMDWMPYDSVTLTSTITLSSALLSGDANLNGIPDVQEFGTVVTPPTPTLVSSALSYLVTASVAAPIFTSNTVVSHTSSESGGIQTINQDSATTVTATTVTTTTTTPVTTDTYSDGSTHAHQGTPVVTTTSSSQSATSHQYADFYGRIDQLEVLDNINDGINGLLNHEPTSGKQRLRVFENNRFVQSYNADGYNADSKIFGGGFEFDATKGWTVGFQYNRVNINLNGVDSRTQQTKDHFGVLSELRGNTLTLNTNAAIANSNYNYNRTVEGVFNNAGSTTGTEWWVSNRLYWHLNKSVKPFVGYTVQNVKRNAYTETGDVRSARGVEEHNQTTHVGEAGLKLETRFGGKKRDLFGVSVEGAYGTDSSYGVSASLDYKEILFVEGSHGVNNGVTNNSVAARVKFKF
jgi:hypothetical protein